MITNSPLKRALFATTLTLPIAVFINDCFYSIFTVKGTSMEPSLKEGDVVLVRKVDFLPYYFHNEKKGPTVQDIIKRGNADPLDEVTDRQKAIKIDASVGKSAGNQFTLWRGPPTCLPGDVVLLKSPAAFTPVEFHSKRLIALGGQLVSFGFWLIIMNKDIEQDGFDFENLVIG